MITRKTKGVNSDSSEDEDFFVRVIVKIGDKRVEQDLEESLSIPMADKLTLPMVLKMLAENPVLHARWNIIYNESVYEYDVLKTKFEVWLAKKSAEYRKDLEKVSKGRVTDKMVEDMIKSDPDFERISEDIAISKKNMKHIFAIANGLGEKGDKIVNIASMLKWEADTLGGNKFFGPKKEYHHIKRDFEDNQKTNEKIDINVNDGWPT
jgi:DNA mismatch repair ATPase MutS